MCGRARKWSDISGGPKWHLGLVFTYSSCSCSALSASPMSPSKKLSSVGRGIIFGISTTSRPLLLQGVLQPCLKAVSLVLGLRCSWKLGHFCLGMAASRWSEAALQSSSQTSAGNLWDHSNETKRGRQNSSLKPRSKKIYEPLIVQMDAFLTPPSPGLETELPSPRRGKASGMCRLGDSPRSRDAHRSPPPC